MLSVGGSPNTFPSNTCHNKDIHKVTLSSPYISPPNPSFGGICKVRKSQYDMLKLSAKC